MDVARKVVILGRVAGLDTSLDTLLVENVVPKELQVSTPGSHFVYNLCSFTVPLLFSHHSCTPPSTPELI